VDGINPLVLLSGQSYYNPFPGQDVNVVRRTMEIPRLTREDAKSFHFDAGLRRLPDFE
jgi:iron complex outermembrane receptor protein